MDIQTWLDESAGAERPLEHGTPPTSAFFHAEETTRPVFHEGNAPKRARSDSSLLLPQPHMHACNDSTHSESSTHPYAPRPRHKTRLDRYHPKPNSKPGKHIHRSRKDESKKSTRKAKRKKSAKHTDTRLAQDFHAKNVSRDRLTLKPREHPGIFNKGKISSTVRGRGLPDLVFSEMKFLQKENDQAEPVAQQAAPKAKRKKDHAHTKEGEISAFFTSARPVLEEKVGNVLTDRVRADEGKLATAGHRGRDPSIKPSGVVPSIEVPSKGACLGFGSRGPRHESTSYVSWSESVRSLDMTSRRPEHSKHRRAGGAEMIDVDIPAPPKVDKQRSHDSHGRFQTSPVAFSQTRVSRSRSYPQHVSPRQRLRIIDRTARFHAPEPVPSMQPSVSQSNMVKLAPCESGVDPEPTQHRQASRSAVDSTVAPQPSLSESREVVPVSRHESSPDLGRVIEHCNRTLLAQRRATEQHGGHLGGHSLCVGDEVGMRNQTAASHVVYRRPMVRFLEVEPPVPRVPHFPGRGIYEQQARRIHVPWEEVTDNEEFLDDSCLLEQDLCFGSYSMVDDELEWEEYLAPAPLEAGHEATDFELDAPEVRGDELPQLPADHNVVAPGFWRPNRLY